MGKSRIERLPNVFPLVSVDLEPAHVAEPAHRNEFIGVIGILQRLMNSPAMRHVTVQLLVCVPVLHPTRR